MVAAETVKNVLASNGYEVVGPEKTGSEGLSKIDSIRPDLVFIGLILKGDLDGLAIAEEIRRNYQVPLLFLTALDSQAFFSNPHRLYPDGYIFHPLKVDQILQSVKVALDMAADEKGPTNAAKNDLKEPSFKPQYMEAKLSENITCDPESTMRLSDVVLFNAKELVRPYIKNLKSSGLDYKQRMLVDGLAENIEKVVSPFLYKLSERYFGLTHAELKVAKLIKDGLTTKEAATQLNLSVSTISTHRDRIRKKIGIKGKKQNLRRFLEQFE